MQINRLGIQRGPHFTGIGKDHPLALDAALRPGQIIDPQDDVLAGDDDRHPVCRRQDIVGRHHQNPGFGLRLDGQRHMDGHLIAVEIGIEGRTDQRMELNRLSLDQDRFKGLKPKPVKGRRPVQHHGIFADDLIEGIPYLGGLLLHHLLGAFNRRDISLFLETPVDEGFEEFQGHLLGKTALMESADRDRP